MNEHGNYNWDAPFEAAFGKPIVKHKPAESGSKTRRARPGAAKGATYAREYGDGDADGTWDREEILEQAGALAAGADVADVDPAAWDIRAKQA